MYKYKKKNEMPFSDMQNKLDLFQIIDKVASGSSDLKWQSLLDTEIERYQMTFQEELQ